MTYVIAEPCIGTKDLSCVEVCPVDCIHPAKGSRGSTTRRSCISIPRSASTATRASKPARLTRASPRTSCPTSGSSTRRSTPRTTSAGTSRSPSPVRRCCRRRIAAIALRDPVGHRGGLACMVTAAGSCGRSSAAGPRGVESGQVRARGTSSRARASTHSACCRACARGTAVARRLGEHACGRQGCGEPWASSLRRRAHGSRGGRLAARRARRTSR